MMTFSTEQRELLKAPLDRKNVAQRSQGGGKVSYIEGWWAISEANRIFGFDGWTRETVHIKQLGEPYEKDGKQRVNYMAMVRITAGGVMREGCGFGQGIDKDVGQAHESALKEAETDAMKRAFMTFGNPFGLALYDKTHANVADEKKPVEPPHVKQAQTIIHKAATITSHEEYEAYYDGIIPQLEELKQASTKAYEHVMAQLNKRETTLRREAA